jgi:hypothetical protein
MERQQHPATLSRQLAVAEVSQQHGLDLVIEANEAERAALAAANGLVAVHSLVARLHARRVGAGGLEIAGELRAKIVQTCVVTLDEFETQMVEPIRLRFEPPKVVKPQRESRRQRRAEIEAIEPPAKTLEIDALGEDPPEPLIGGAVDIGAAAEEFFTLGLAPYPRKPGAAFAEAAPADDARVSPFAKLGAKLGAKRSSSDNPGED